MLSNVTCCVSLRIYIYIYIHSSLSTTSEPEIQKGKLAIIAVVHQKLTFTEAAGWFLFFLMGCKEYIMYLYIDVR
jgi:hypothetical protein